MSQKKPPTMVSTRVTPVPAKDTSTKPERPVVRRTISIEDRVDYIAVRNARSIAQKRGEKPMAWNEFKKKLAR